MESPQKIALSNLSHSLSQSTYTPNLHALIPATLPSPSLPATDNVPIHDLQPADATVSTTKPSCCFLRPRLPFRLATFNVRTLKRPGQLSSLAHTLESLLVDVCTLQETRIQDSSDVIRLSSPAHPEVKFHLRLSGDSEASASGHAGVGIALNSRAEAALSDWFPVNSRLWTVRLESSCRIKQTRSDTRSLFVAAAYAPTDCSPEAAKDAFYQELHNLLRKANRADIVILAGDMNARIGRLSSSELHLGGRYGLDNCRSDNGERFLHLCADHNLYIASTNFRHSSRHSATWRSSSSTKTWTQIDHIAISYRWRGSVQDCRLYWSTSLDSDHALVCARLSMMFGGRPKRSGKRLNLAKLSDPATLADYQQALASHVPSRPPNDGNTYWSQILEAMKKASLSSCGLTKRTTKPWVSADTLRLLDARRSIQAKHEYDTTRKSLKRQIHASLRKDREAWWSDRATEMEAAAAVGNTRKFFHLIRTTGTKRPGVSETI